MEPYQNLTFTCVQDEHARKAAKDAGKEALANGATFDEYWTIYWRTYRKVIGQTTQLEEKPFFENVSPSVC